MASRGRKGAGVGLQEIETRLEKLDLDQGFDLIYDLLLAYGHPKASVSRVCPGFG